MRLCASASGRQHVLCCAHLPAANAGPLYNVFSRGIVGIKVIDPSEDSRVPFLRGILTRSLCQAGMRFSEAYTIANEVRNKLSSRSEISTEELTALVARVLDKKGYEEVRKRYLEGPTLRVSMLVYHRDGSFRPFSRTRLAQSLECCALPADDCYAIASAIDQHLMASGVQEIQSTQLEKITYEFLLDREPREVANRYLSWLEFFRSGEPLVLLVGGTTGSGKSTICSEVAHRLNIVRTQSTDMLREVMRLILPSRLIPSLHASSFNAWKTLPTAEGNPVTFEDHFVEGYLTQARQVQVAIEGVLRRAEREQISLILEGVHVFPALQRQLEAASAAIVTPVVLAVPKRKQLRRQLKGRGQQVSNRRAERYLEHFDEIWELQSFLLDEAERYDVPIIPNVDEQEAVRLFLEAVSERLTRRYKGSPKSLFN